MSRAVSAEPAAAPVGQVLGVTPATVNVQTPQLIFSPL